MLKFVSVFALFLACCAGQVEEPALVAAPSCTPLPEVWNEAQLVQAQFDAESLEGRAVFLKQLDATHGIAFLLVRTSCTDEWHGVKAIPVTFEAPACVPTDTTQCL